ncbi:hypothetical protein GEMRC1_006424 [Eukaryota sp. GEM-RC1]
MNLGGILVSSSSSSSFTTKSSKLVEIVSLSAQCEFIKSNFQSPTSMLLRSAFQAWEKGRLPTLDFLMLANFAAGRSFDDIGQYPVLPWLFSDYTSSTISLSPKGPHTRDLSKPMGAQLPKRAKEFQDRFDSWVDNSIPPFHYGSLYSNPGVVVNWLIRLEPFASALVKLQSGYFDSADRLTSSINAAWRSSAMGGPSDVKELVPELYSSPDVFFNNSLVLGTRQDNIKVNHLELPSWCRSFGPLSGMSFCFFHRRMLDTSASLLPDWLDLIFGRKQSGPPAIEALNTFYYVAYPSSMAAILKLGDSTAKASARHQVHCFGAIPNQIWPNGCPRISFSYGLPRNLAPWWQSPDYLKSEEIPRTSVDSRFINVNFDLSGDVPVPLPPNVYSGSEGNWYVSSRYNTGLIGFGPEKKSLEVMHTVTFATVSDSLFLCGTRTGKSFLFTNTSSNTPLLLTCFSGVHTSSIISTSISHLDNIVATLDSSGVFAVWELSDSHCIYHESMPGLIKVELTVILGTLSLALVSKHSIIVVSPFKGLDEIRCSTPNSTMLPSISGCSRPVEKLNQLEKIGSFTGSVVLVTCHFDGFLRLWSFKKSELYCVKKLAHRSGTSLPLKRVICYEKGIVSYTDQSCFFWSVDAKTSEEVKNTRARSGSSTSKCLCCKRKFGFTLKPFVCDSCDGFACSSCMDNFVSVKKSEKSVMAMRMCFVCAFNDYAVQFSSKNS